jgi:hypothetical protein
MPLNHRASVVTGLAFLESWIRRQPKWQAKDLLVLFYEELDYAFGVREFLEAYYQQARGSTSNRQEAFAQKIEGRCGYIRQAYVFQFTDYEYNKISMFIDGVNAQSSDIDFYDATQKGLTKLDWKLDFSLPSYFKQNPYLESVSKFFTQYARAYFMQGLNLITTNLLDQQVNGKGTILQLFENIKNQYVGKPHQPHSYLVEYGVHAISLRGTHDPKIRQLGERDRVMKTVGAMEHLLRITDQLDEQLHAGFYFYLLTSRTTFVSNTGFVYPIVCILVGFFVYNMIRY